MAKSVKLQEVAIDLLKPYERNAKMHPQDQVDKIIKSIEEFGFVTPCVIDSDYNLIAGHGRVRAAKEMGLETVPCVFVEGLTDAQRKAYILADNRLGELGEWDMDLVFDELQDLKYSDFEVDLTGFELPEDSDWFETRKRFDMDRQEGNDEYNAFLDKFEIAKTTDDCYTPDNIYEVVADYVCEKYGKDRADFVRPFKPGGDYQSENYRKGCVVVDNPPFSILAEIIDFYVEKNQPFFLFAPGLATLNYTNRDNVTAICVYAEITYENGASVVTSFLTNLIGSDVAAITDPDLYKSIADANTENEKKLKKHFPKYDYPYEVLTAAKMGWLSKYGQSLVIKRRSSMMIRALDAQKEEGKGIYGGALLLSERAAAERAAAERAAAERAAAERAAAERAAATCFELSDRERNLIKELAKAEEDDE